MSYEYAVVFKLTVNRESKYGDYDSVVSSFICENHRMWEFLGRMWEFLDFDTDFYFERPEIESLPSGEYLVYARGIVEFESDRDWETVVEGGHFILGIDKLSIDTLDKS